MDAQMLINVLTGVVLAGVGWWLNNTWAMLKSLQEQISAVNLKLAENYAPRAELQNTFDRIFEKLDEIQKGMKP